MTDSTDMEIYQDIMDARAACENLKINGGNDLMKAHPLNFDLCSMTFSTQDIQLANTSVTLMFPIHTKLRLCWA